MLTLIHGDNIETSRKELNALKAQAKDKEVRIINGKKFDLTQFTQAIESSSLFGGDVLVVVEGLLSTLNKRTKASAGILETMKHAAESADIVLYEEKEVDKSTITKLGTNSKISLFKTPVIIFHFLDGVAPHSSKRLLPVLENLVSQEPAEVVYVLLMRRIKHLIQILDRVTPLGMQSWQVARLTGQARGFTMDQLIGMHTQLLEYDIAIKSGKTPFTFAQLLQQFIIKLDNIGDH